MNSVSDMRLSCREIKTGFQIFRKASLQCHDKLKRLLQKAQLGRHPQITPLAQIHLDGGFGPSSNEICVICVICG
jgi:hypothetical protein